MSSSMEEYFDSQGFRVIEDEGSLTRIKTTASVEMSGKLPDDLTNVDTFSTLIVGQVFREELRLKRLDIPTYLDIIQDFRFFFYCTS